MVGRHIQRHPADQHSPGSPRSHTVCSRKLRKPTIAPPPLFSAPADRLRNSVIGAVGTRVAINNEQRSIRAIGYCSIRKMALLISIVAKKRADPIASFEDMDQQKGHGRGAGSRSGGNIEKSVQSRGRYPGVVLYLSPGDSGPGKRPLLLASKHEPSPYRPAGSPGQSEHNRNRTHARVPQW